VKKDEEKQDHARDSLNQVKPVSRIRIGQIVGPRFHRDHQTIDCVIDERYKDAADLDEENVGDRLEVAHRVVEVVRAGKRFRVRVKML